MRLSKWAGGARRVGALAIAAVLVHPMPAPAATAWSLVPSARLTDAGQNYLDGVSCATGSGRARVTATCFAVGSLISETGQTRPLIERWNGRGWSVVASPSKPHTIASALVAVSCATPKSCMAVGNSRTSAAPPTVPLVERWNGSKWSVVPTPIPKGSTGTYLDAVSCSTAKACIAVGNYTSSFTSGSTLVVRWNGKKWALMTSPNPARSAVTQLLGVSCIGGGPALTCWAVGQYALDADGTPYYTVTERLAHGEWTVVASPNGHGDHSSQLMSVSCSSTKSCFAAGSWDHAYGATLVERWNGARWTVLKSANPRGFTLSQLSGISCASARSCVATGTFTIGTAPGATLIEQWNGRAWTIQPSANPPKAANSALTGVSCVEAMRCVAVGSYLTNKFGNPAAGYSQHRS
jgi:hypothetical protein